MRAAWGDTRVWVLALLLALGVAYRALLLPVATDADAPDELLGVAQLVWWARCQLTGQTGALLLLRPPRA
jgi:hypothetical protein